MSRLRRGRFDLAIGDLSPNFDFGSLPRNGQDDVDPDYKRLVKAADIISAYLKANDEIRFGNAEFNSVKDRLAKMLADFEQDMPEVRYFLDTFERNCLASVDELTEQDT